MSFLLLYWRQIAALAVMAALFGGGWYQGSSHEIKKQELALASAQKEAFDRYTKEVTEKNRIAEELEKAKVTREVIYRDVVKRIEKVVDRPIYLQECIDGDGMTLINESISKLSIYNN